MRLALRQKIEAGMLAIVVKKDWSHITEQIGMFCFTGLSLEQVTVSLFFNVENRYE